MNNRGLSFEIAFKEVFRKWEVQLEQVSNGFWASRWKRGPKVFMDKWVEESKKQFLYSFLSSVVMVFVVVLFIEIYKSDAVLKTIEQVFRNLCLLGIVLMAVGLILIFKSDRKTSYGFMFERFGITSIMFLYFGKNTEHLFNHYPVSISDLFIGTLFVSFFISFAASSFYYLYKHFQFEKKLSKV